VITSATDFIQICFFYVERGRVPV